MGNTRALGADQKKTVLTGLRHLCRLYWGPSPRLCRQMVDGRFTAPFHAMASLSLRGATDALTQIEACIGSASDATVLFQTLEETYVRLFISSRQGVAAPLYQSCYAYDGAPLMGPPALVMRERLAAVGLTLSGITQEPPDHLAVELEYLYFLLDKGWTHSDAAYTAEAADFIETELGTWIDPFTERVAQAPDPALFAPAAVLTKTVIDWIGQYATA